MKAYELLRTLAALFLLAGLSGVQGQESVDTVQPDSLPANLGPTDYPDHVTLSWTSDPKTTQTVTWRTDTTVNTGVVQYGTDPKLRTSTKKSVVAKVTRLKTDLGDQNIYTATLKSLRPGVRYYYRVGDGIGKWSPIYSFRTEGRITKCFKFLVFGDTQALNNTPDYAEWQSAARNAYRANPDASFFTVVGDEAQCGQSMIHWNHWFSACKGIIESISYMPVEGNTECKYMNKSHGVPHLYIAQFNVPPNGPFNNCEAYSYDYANVHFVVLNSQLRETLKFRPNLLEEQKAWLEKDLSQTKKEWIVVLWHKPPYPCRSYRTAEGIKANFTPIMDKYHVDVVFNGHDHAYTRTYPINDGQIVNSPALGTVYVITGRSGVKILDGNERKAWSTNFFDPQDMPNYMVVEVCGSRMQIKAYKMDGTLIDDYTIDKRTGDRPQTVVPCKYNSPWLMVNGILLNRPLMPTDPHMINGKWYLPIKPVVEFLGGSESVSGDDQTLTLIVENYQSSPIWEDEKYHTVVITKGSTDATIDDIPITLPDPVVVENVEILGGDDDDDPVVVESAKSFLISADDMNALFGFTWRYDSSWNVLSLINPSKIGE